MREQKKRNVEKKSRRKAAAAGVRTAGTILLTALVLLCLPLTAPRLFGCHIYSVISGSMEPAIPTGSLVYIQTAADPAQIQAEDVIAFCGSGDPASIITHRVVENRTVMGEFITKGDANQTEDMNPVPYENYIGKVVRSIPAAGRIAEWFTSRTGKASAGGVIVSAVLLQLLASWLEHDPKTDAQ